MINFKIECVSISGGPTIEFKFEGSLCTAECVGAKLTADAVDTDRANLQIVDVTGELIADIMVRKMPKDENITVSLISIGSALLWRHAAWDGARRRDSAAS